MAASEAWSTATTAFGQILKRYLIERLGMPDTPNSPKPIFRLARENDLFAEPLAKLLGYGFSAVLAIRLVRPCSPDCHCACRGLGGSVASQEAETGFDVFSPSVGDTGG